MSDFLFPCINAQSTLILVEPIFISSGMLHILVYFVMIWCHLQISILCSSQSNLACHRLCYNISGWQVWLKYKERWLLPESLFGLSLRSSISELEPLLIHTHLNWKPWVPGLRCFREFRRLWEAIIYHPPHLRYRKIFNKYESGNFRKLMVTENYEKTKSYNNISWSFWCGTHQSVFTINRVGRGLESPNPDSLFLDNEAKPRKVLRLPINSIITRQWLKPRQKPNIMVSSSRLFLRHAILCHVKLFLNI